MVNVEKIRLLKAKVPEGCCFADYYYNLLDRMGDLKRNYASYMTSSPIDSRKEMRVLPYADYDYACALLTLLLREDHFAQYGYFDRKVEDGTVQKIIDRMVELLVENKPRKRMSKEEIQKNLAGRAAEYLMFKDDEGE